MKRSQALRQISSNLRRSVEPAEHADRLLDQHGIKSFTSMRELARRLGIEVEEVDGLPSNVGGFAGRDNRGRFMAIDRRMHPVHQEVTAAHELGHHFTHDVQQEHLETPAQRREADMFAMGLLLKDEFRITSAEFRRENPDMSIDVLTPMCAKGLAVIFEMAASLAECFEQANRVT
jgi:IrrE N-terminal-like domain